MKRYILFAGVNGAGKSTLYQIKDTYQNIPRINIDEISKEIGDWRDPKVVFGAGRKARCLLKGYFDLGISFNQETTLCGKSILKNIKLAKENDYIIEMHYVGVNTVDIAKQRVAYRVEHGGHGIPEKDIERRYIESMMQLKQIFDSIDLLILYDNSVKFHRFAVYSLGKQKHISSNIPTWFKRYLKDETC